MRCLSGCRPQRCRSASADCRPLTDQHHRTATHVAEFLPPGKRRYPHHPLGPATLFFESSRQLPPESRHRWCCPLPAPHDGAAREASVRTDSSVFITDKKTQPPTAMTRNLSCGAFQDGDQLQAVTPLAEGDQRASGRQSSPPANGPCLIRSRDGHVPSFSDLAHQSVDC